MAYSAMRANKLQRCRTLPGFSGTQTYRATFCIKLGRKPMRDLRIFISSPMDVTSERTVAHRVIARLAAEHCYRFRIEPVMSELEPIVATHTPQASITPPSEADIVVTLLWSRLGTPLPDDPRFAINETSRPTGTEWEFVDAFRAHQARGQP